jgi:hypothetical protein
LSTVIETWLWHTFCAGVNGVARCLTLVHTEMEQVYFRGTG